MTFRSRAAAALSEPLVHFLLVGAVLTVTQTDMKRLLGYSSVSHAGFLLLALTALSPFRPRRWKGALVKNSSVIEFRILEAERRPVSAVADQVEVRDVVHVKIMSDLARRLELLFDPDYALDDRILMEQFIA